MICEVGFGQKRVAHTNPMASLHVFHGEGHYILLTGICEKGICAFDPYYKGNEVDRPGIEINV